MQQYEIDQLVTDALKKALEFYEHKDYGSAEELYRQILRVDRTNQEALTMGSLTICNNGKAEEAKEWTVRALSMDHSNYKLYNNLGLIHGSLNEHDKAIRCFRSAISMNPTEAYLYTNLAIEHKKQGNTEEALSILENAINEYPDNEHICFNYGAIVHELAMYERAVELYKRAIKINPKMAVAHYNLSACYFLLGDYTKAWTEYEWRWQQFTSFAKVRNRFNSTYWTGQNLKGKTIVLYVEQGVGDTIMMCRFVPYVKDMGARVILEVIPPLYDLMKSLKGVDELSTNYMGLADYNCSLLSVPGVLGITDEIPSSSRYLSSVGLGASESWNKYNDKIKIGICWAGNPQHPNDRNRSIKLKYFKSLAENENVRLFGFQKDTRPHVYPDIGAIDYCESASSVKFITMGEHMTDFNKTAKMLESMDVVVSADTAIAHLAGALGISTYLLLPYLPDWHSGLCGAAY